MSSCTNTSSNLTLPTVNPSYITNEVTFESCPYVSASANTTTQWTQNVQQIPGDSVLGIYGKNFQQFIQPTTCLKCGLCDDNTVTDIYYKPTRSIEFPTYGVFYRGQNNLFRQHPYRWGHE
jgi:NAD-dependent dihydropyrimidine dehydrogenase PreA subunit